jgi:hypothetical protein
MLFYGFAGYFLMLNSVYPFVSVHFVSGKDALSSRDGQNRFQDKTLESES